MTGSRLRAAKTTSSHGNPRPLFLKTEPAHRQLALGSRGDRVHISGQSTELGLVSLAALTPRGQRPDDSHMCGSALRRQENREELGLGPHGTCVPANNHAGRHLKGNYGICTPGRTWVCLLELARSFPFPKLFPSPCTPEPDDAFRDV